MVENQPSAPTRPTPLYHHYVRASQLLADRLPGRAYDANRVDSLVHDAVADAQRRWPGVELPIRKFVAWLADRTPGRPPALEDALDMLALADLYLACACATGDARALAAFDATFLAGDRRTSDDVKQRARERLFVGESRIALYSGRGALGPWIGATLRRMTIDEARASREIPTEDALMNAVGIDPGYGPELAHVKNEVRATIQTAFRDAVATLSDRDRMLLISHYIDGVGVVELGARLGLAASNISRGIAKIRLQLVAQIRRSLMRNNNIPGSELDSLVDLVRSQLSLTTGLRNR